MSIPESGDFRMAGAYVEVNLKDNTEADEAAIRERIEKGAAAKLPVELDKASADDTEAKVKEKTKAIGETSPVKTKLELDDASVAQWEAKIKAITDAATRSSSVQPDSSASPVPAAGGGTGGVLIPAAIGLGAGALGGAALLSIPAVFAAIGIAAEKSNTQVGAAFSGMETAAKSSLQTGFSPFVPTLVSIANQAKATVTAMEPQFAAAAQATVPLLQSLSTGLLTATREGVGDAVPIIQQLQPAADAAGQGFVQLERGIGGFLRNIDVQQSAQGFSALFGAIEQVLPAAGDLLSTIMPLGNALLAVLGPAVRDTMNDLAALKPVTEASGAVLKELGPDISLYGPILLGVMSATKLLTGSFTDFGGVATKLKSIMQDSNGEFDKGRSTLNSLAKAIGITTDSAKQSAVADATATAEKAKLVAAADAEAAKEAILKAAKEQTAVATLAASEADKTAAASAKAAAVAQDALTAAEEASTFAMGPLGAAIAGIGLLLLPFIGNMTSSSDATDKMTGELDKLQQAASDTQALSNLFKTDPQAEQQLAMLQKYGVTLRDLADANNGDAVAQKKVADAAKEATDAAQRKLDIDEKTRPNVRFQTEAAKADTDAWNVANQTYQDAKNQLDATTAAQEAQSAAAMQSAASNGVAATGVHALGESLGQATSALSAFLAANTGASVGDQFLAITQDAVAAGNALQNVSDHFKQTAQAASSSAQSYQDSLHSEAQANQAVATARQGVVLAERAVADAVTNVGIAQDSETKAVVAAQQAQVNLNTARATAIEQLKTLHLQLADQVTSEESARLALFDQTNKSAVLGVTTANAAAIAAETVTSTNEAQVQSAIDLLKAEQALNDTLNTGANLRTQVTQADQAGVENAPNVLSAKQALASANDQVTSAQQALLKATQAVSDAQDNVAKAEQGVKDALYNEQKAAQSTAQAFQAMTTAQEANSHTLDLNTAAGRANALMQAQAAQAIMNSHEPLAQQIADMQSLGQQFGDSNQMGQLLIQNLAKLSGVNISFDVKGVATIDMTQLEQSLYPGSTPASISADLKDLARGGSALFHAEGGPIDGVGGPTDDANLAFLSAGEHVWTAEEVQKFGGHKAVEALRRSVRGYASGGQVGTNDANIATLLLTGYDDAIGSGYVVGGKLKQVFGFPFMDLPTPVTSAGSPGSAAYAQYVGSANLEGWIQTAIARTGVGQGWDAPLHVLIGRESGGNPNAINLTDSNARAGDPSRGLMQTIATTFEAYRDKSLPDNIFDPVANIVAGIHYIESRYGSIFNVQQANPNLPPKGYDGGGYAKPGDTLLRNSTSDPEMLLPPGMTRTMEALNAAVHSGAVVTASGGANHYVTNNWNVSTQDPYVAARLVAAQQAWNNMIGAHG